MNSWRTALIAILITYLAVVAVYALVEIARGMEPLLSWLGLAIAAIPPLVYLAPVRYRKHPTADRPPLAYSILSGLGVAITMTQSWRYGPAAGIVHVWAGLALVVWVAFIRWGARTT